MQSKNRPHILRNLEVRATSNDSPASKDSTYSPASNDYTLLGSIHYESADTLIEFWKDPQGAVYFSMRNQPEVCHNYMVSHPEELGPQTVASFVRGVTRQTQHDPKVERNGIKSFSPRHFYQLYAEIDRILNPAYS